MKTIFLCTIETTFLQHPQDFILQEEQQHWQRLQEIAEDLARHRRTCPIILLSGPSGSGKTTTAMMLESILDRMGLETHTLSMDHYFKSMTPEQLQLAEAGKLNLESPERVDIPFLNAQLEKIRDSVPVELPKYDFRISKRVPSGRVLQRKPEELVILEGIHTLNPEVVTLSGQEVARCYVNVQANLQTAGGQQIDGSYIRLLRRMIRDQNYRKRSLSDTIRLYDSVQAGEAEYITPYRHLAQYQINTFAAYESFVYASIFRTMPTEFQIAQAVPELEELLKTSVPISMEWIPKNALIREFIGGSVYYGEA